MQASYSVRLLKLSSGERFPVLLDLESGLPDFSVTSFSLIHLRGRNLAVNTIRNSVYHLKVFLTFLISRKIDLRQRMVKSDLLFDFEIQDLVDFCKLNLGVLNKRQALSNVKFPYVPDSVISASAANRIRLIAEYLNFLVVTELVKLDSSSQKFRKLDAVKKLCIDSLLARAPDGGNRNFINQRQGLDELVAKKLLEVTSRSSSENPWKGTFVRVRNELIIRWLYALGLRRAELLNVKVSDIDFRQEKVTVFRRPDELSDPRINAPNVKTAGRIIPLSSDLCRMTYEYVLNVRRLLPLASKHEYLIVADKTGAPLSIDALNKLFMQLRRFNSFFPSDLTCHVLRHTWNDNFSVSMDASGVSEADERKMRSYLMGWSEFSGTAAQYTRRHVRKKANQVSLAMQNKILNDKNE